MIGYLVERIGRPATFAVLIFASLVSLLFLLGAIWAFAPGREPTITPATVAAEGCCTIVVYVNYAGNPVSGRYGVITEEGRRPKRTSGKFSDGKIQVLVGDDWIGQVRIAARDYEKLTDLIGGPFGVEERTIDMWPP